jgi:hypothetical protein
MKAIVLEDVAKLVVRYQPEAATTMSSAITATRSTCLGS